MKKILLLALLIGFGTISSLQAQFTGKKFLSGDALINFQQNEDEPDISRNEYGYNLNLSFGKFKTENQASGWTISNSLAGGKRFYQINTGGAITDFSKSGITSVGFGVGRFWQFYKHFNEHVGIFGGPSVDLSYSNSINYSSNDGYLLESKINKVNLGLTLSAGVYYNLSEKWWLTASIAYANPIAISFQSANYSNPPATDVNFKTKQLDYQLTPAFTFPSVGLGVRYFYGR
jgi:opacity protein-like surface antigen